MTPAQIKKLRDKLGETRIQFAERLGLNRETIRLWENGAWRPDKWNQYMLKQLMENSNN